MENIIEVIGGVKVIVDDILVWDSSNKEHGKRLQECINRVPQANLKFKPDKAEIVQDDVNYVSHIPTHDGVKRNSECLREVVNKP